MHGDADKSMTDAELEDKGYNLQQAYTKIGGFGKKFVKKVFSQFFSFCI